MSDVNEIKEYSFSAGKFSFSFLNLGLAITSLNVPDKNGKVENVTLPFVDVKNHPEQINLSSPFLGLTVGRVANRISNARFSLNGKTYEFEPDPGVTCICHSGDKGLWHRFWRVHREEDGFSCFCSVADMEDGYPGNLDVTVRFSLTSDGVFAIRYKAVCSEDCPVNLTNHTYFNLTGDSKKSVYDHLLTLNCSRYVETDNALIPTGNVPNVEGTVFDFRKPKKIGQDILPLTKIDTIRGYDHCFAIDRPGNAERGFTQFCKVYEPESGRVMVGHTDLPGVQLYTGNFLNVPEFGYDTYTGFCLETEFYPDSINVPHFQDIVLKKGEIFESTTTYSFYAV